MNTLKSNLVPVVFLLASSSLALADDPVADTSTASPSAAPADASVAPADPAGASTATADAPAATDTPPVVHTGLLPSSPDIPGFDNRFYVAPLGTYALHYKGSEDGRGGKNGYGGRIVVGKSVVPHFGLEVMASYIRFNGKDAEQIDTAAPGCVSAALTPGACTVNKGLPNEIVTTIGVGVNLFLSSSNHGLYAHADAMGGSEFLYEGGLGYELLLGNHIGLRAEALYADINPNKGARPLFNFGVFIPIGDIPSPPAPPAPAPVAVVPAEVPPPPPPPPPCQAPAPGESINLDGCKTGDSFVLNGVNFEFNKSTLTLNAKTILDQVVLALKAHPNLKIELDGHTDSIGKAKYNQKLSERRAASVKAYLVSNGIDAGHLSSKGFGATMPIADNGTQAGRDQNRRTELKIVDAGGTTDVPVSSGGSDNTAPPTTGSAAPDTASSGPTSPQ